MGRIGDSNARDSDLLAVSPVPGPEALAQADGLALEIAFAESRCLHEEFHAALELGPEVKGQIRVGLGEDLVPNRAGLSQRSLAVLEGRLGLSRVIGSGLTEVLDLRRPLVRAQRLPHVLGVADFFRRPVVAGRAGPDQGGQQAESERSTLRATGGLARRPRAGG